MAKIIGTTPNGFVLDISQDEVANLLGYYSRYSFGGDSRERPRREAPQVGDKIEIAQMYHHLSKLSMASSDVLAMASKLRVAADLIDTLPNPLTEAKAQPDQPAADSTKA